MNTRLIPVWDPFVRLFHWLLVAAFLTSWLTQEEHYNLHLQAGYATLVLVCLRIAWGTVGTHYARFTNFICSPSCVYAYLKSIADGSSERFIGHNPAGGAMIVAQIAGLLTVTISGIALDGAENWSGPFAEMGFYRHTPMIHAIHVQSTNLLLVLIVMHLLGVVHTSLAHRENLVRAMITGKKRA